ncbi:uncharacterized protein EURHEDRAFT_180952 [Aspergillus ruber CBS 135680]|uniref:Uncharacterized protein n=1 Tax=Aspergillus ruber (strain CBS 135680) TaxID=1388766 RepID=A0A017S763_ASPRC|nr:uncharacterized protein EURHEDRAFT_180952 [Aspergillus ruber CBS 135680]EYE92802.1 hypothetical protein EURHEDRAFT_180952 [Aspergillus ruber CBS 135680]
MVYMFSIESHRSCWRPISQASTNSPGFSRDDSIHRFTICRSASVFFSAIFFFLSRYFLFFCSLCSPETQVPPTVRLCISDQRCNVIVPGPQPVPLASVLHPSWTTLHCLAETRPSSPFS